MRPLVLRSIEIVLQFLNGILEGLAVNSLCIFYPYLAAQYFCLLFGVNHLGLGLEKDTDTLNLLQVYMRTMSE